MDPVTNPTPAPQQPAQPAAAPVPAKKPVYKEVWFWVIVVGVAGVIFASIATFAFTMFMVRADASLYSGYGTSERYDGEYGPSFDTNSGCSGDCGCPNSNGQNYNYQDNSGSSNSYNGDGSSSSDQADPFSQFPEDVQEQLRRFHEGTEGFQDLQQYKQVVPQSSAPSL